MWSWHIWVTDYVPGTGDKTVTNFQNNNYTLMPVNLGWCSGETTTYAGRSVKVKFKQTGTSEEQVITIKQKEHIIVTLGNSTYYQWGRKDPFVGGVEVNYQNKNKTWYDADGSAHNGGQTIPNSYFAFGDNNIITTGIKSPNIFNTNYYADYQSRNLWSANNDSYNANDDEVIKTIYDPCPAGYKMPPGNVFTGFSLTGNSTTSMSDLNVSGAWDAGWNFYCGLNKTGETVFFPVTGRRNSNNSGIGLYGFYGYGYYWSAAPNDTRNGWLLSFYLSRLAPFDRDNIMMGFGVRPCQE